MRTMKVVRRYRRNAGYTLLELAISISVGGVLSVGIAATMSIAGRIAATPLGVEPTIKRTETAVDIQRDLQNAFVVFPSTSGETSSIRCLTPDSDGDGRPERIEFDWSGSGEPITRSFNNKDAKYVQNVKAFTNELGYDIVVEKSSRSQQTSPAILASYLAGSTKMLSLESGKRIARAVDPRRFGISSLADEPTAFTITSVRIFVDAEDVAVGAKLYIYNADHAGWPVGAPLSEVVLTSKMFNGMGQATVAVITPSLAMGSPVAIVLEPGTRAFGVLSGTTTDGQPACRSSRDGGATWVEFLQAPFDLHFTLTGSFLIPGDPILTRRKIARRAEMRLQLQDTPTTFEISFANRPEICQDWIGFDGKTNPLETDLNGDNIADFVEAGQVIFDFKDGCLVLQGTYEGHLLAKSQADQVTPRILHARLHPFGSVDGSITVLCKSSSQLSALLKIAVKSAGEQCEIIFSTVDGDIPVELATVVAERSEFDVRCLILPAEDLVDITVDRRPIGTFALKYASGSASSIPDLRLVGAGNLGFDELSYRLIAAEPK
jgi:hypothetical protein